ncbi:MAG: hypothetical protein O3A36_03790 [bacterium]|nr:hypothetical protein [bacterium]
MTMPMDPNKAVQKFYSKTMEGGCAIVAFYNYRNDAHIPDEEVAQLVQTAVELYATVPYRDHDSGQLVVVVDITNFLRISYAMRVSQENAALVHVGFWDILEFDGTPAMIKAALAEHASNWKARAASRNKKAHRTCT